VRSWTALLLVVQAWHALAVFALPASAPGGSASWIGLPFHGYMAMHTSYQRPGDGFLVASTLLDVVETLVWAAGLRAGWRSARGLRLIALGHLMYAYKAVVVIAIEVASGFPYTSHLSRGALLGGYFLPQLSLLALSAVVAHRADAARTGASGIDARRC
jgi:hypothetical protein